MRGDKCDAVEGGAHKSQVRGGRVFRNQYGFNELESIIIFPRRYLSILRPGGGRKLISTSSGNVVRPKREICFRSELNFHNRTSGHVMNPIPYGYL